MSHYDYTYKMHPIPPGWNAYTDACTGRVYYANEVTGQSQWEPPLMTPSNITLNNSTPYPTKVSSDTWNSSIINSSNTPGTSTSSSSAISQASLQQSNILTAIPNSSLLTSTRASMIQGMSSQANNNTLPFIDYPGIPAGMIADLVHLQLDWRASQYQTVVQQTHDVKAYKDDYHKSCYYEPIQPFEMPLSLKDRQVEMGRVAVRYRTLMDELQKITSRSKKE